MLDLEYGCEDMEKECMVDPVGLHASFLMHALLLFLTLLLHVKARDVQFTCRSGFDHAHLQF